MEIDKIDKLKPHSATPGPTSPMRRALTCGLLGIGLAPALAWSAAAPPDDGWVLLDGWVLTCKDLEALARHDFRR